MSRLSRARAALRGKVRGTAVAADDRRAERPLQEGTRERRPEREGLRLRQGAPAAGFVPRRGDLRRPLARQSSSTSIGARSARVSSRRERICAPPSAESPPFPPSPARASRPKSARASRGLPAPSSGTAATLLLAASLIVAAGAGDALPLFERTAGTPEKRLAAARDVKAFLFAALNHKNCTLRGGRWAGTAPVPSAGALGSTLDPEIKAAVSRRPRSALPGYKSRRRARVLSRRREDPPHHLPPARIDSRADELVSVVATRPRSEPRVGRQARRPRERRGTWDGLAVVGNERRGRWSLLFLVTSRDRRRGDAPLQGPSSPALATALAVR